MAPQDSGDIMQKAQQGDQVRLHYVKRLQDGSRFSSSPLVLTVGVEHPHLRGLGLDLVGVTPGEQIRLSVPPNQAYGPYDPNRIRRLPASRFSHFESISVG